MTSSSSDDGTPPGFVIGLPATADAPALARRFVREHSDDLPQPLIDDATILVSELVTNAITHGRPDITLQIRRNPPGIGVAVDDNGVELPDPSGVLEMPDTDVVNGRGLLIVDALASQWGISPHDPPPGKTVWFELR